MTKRFNAKKKMSRRHGVNLWGRANDTFEVKNYAPGEHGQLRKRILSDYGKQLMAKQKLKRYYGNITEKQFHKTYKEAVRRKGDTGQNLIGLLESRIDALIYRSNFVPTVFSARQFANHRHLTVNGVKVNIPSYRLKVGDVVQIREKSRQIPMVLESVQNMERDIPDYIEVDHTKMTAKILRLPNLEDVPYPTVMEPNLVIEFYSKK